MNRSTRILFVVAAMATVALGLGPARAEEKKLGWGDTAELSFVLTAGNSSTTTLGFKNSAVYNWQDAAFSLNVGGVRADARTYTRVADIDGNVSETSSKDKTAENYFLDARYDRVITDKLSWYANAGWYRNEFAGIKSRYLVGGGIGYKWYDTDDMKWFTFAGLTFTKETPVVEIPSSRQAFEDKYINGADFKYVAPDDTYLGLQAGWNYLNKLTDSTTYGNDLVIDLNTSEMSDWRGSMNNWVAVAINAKLALKASLLWMYDNQPAFREVPAFDADVRVGTAIQELKKLDTLFTTSLVVKF